MAIDATAAQRRPGADPDPWTPLRRRRPRWWLVLLAAVAAIAVAVVVVIQLLPNPADGPAVVGATQVTPRGGRLHPPVIQVRPGQTVTWVVDDHGTTTTSRAPAGAPATRRRGPSGTPSPRPAATGTPAPRTRA